MVGEEEGLDPTILSAYDNQGCYNPVHLLFRKLLSQGGDLALTRQFRCYCSILSVLVLEYNQQAGFLLSTSCLDSDPRLKTKHI